MFDIKGVHCGGFGIKGVHCGVAGIKGVHCSLSKRASQKYISRSIKKIVSL